MNLLDQRLEAQLNERAIAGNLRELCIPKGLVDF